MGRIHDGSIGIPNGNGRGSGTMVDHWEILEKMGGASSVGDDVESSAGLGTNGGRRTYRWND
jgi:hypothetical protein